MSKLIVFGDTHARSKEPFYTAISQFFDWAKNQSWNNSDNTMIHVGDMFHHNKPSPETYRLVLDFLQSLDFRTIHILSGNGIHEYNRIEKSWAIDPLNSVERVILHKTPTSITFDQSLSCLLLPWFPSYVGNDGNRITMQETYENYTTTADHDYIFGHFAHRELFGEKINIDHILGKKRMGHVHSPDEEYIGVNVISRYDEKGIDTKLLEIDIDSKAEKVIPIPKFLDYETLSYNQRVPKRDYNVIWDIKDAPSVERANNKYPNIHIRNIDVDKNKIEISEKEVEKKNSVLEYFNSYVKDTKLNKETEKVLRGVL